MEGATDRDQALRHKTSSREAGDEGCGMMLAERHL